MNRTPAAEQAKFRRMHEVLDRDIERIIAAIDNGGVAIQVHDEDKPFALTPALFAGLCTAKVLLAHAQYTQLGDEREGGWAMFRSRLQFTCSAVTDAHDSGQPTQFALWDGLHFAAVEAGKLDDETVLMDGRSGQARPTAGPAATTTAGPGTATPPAGDGDA